MLTVKHPLASKFQTITVSSAAIGLTAANYSPGDATSGASGSAGNLHIGRKNADKALITVETAELRWTCDGTTPTTTLGHKALVDDVISLDGFDAIRLFRAIAVAGDSTIMVSYFGA